MKVDAEMDHLLEVLREASSIVESLRGVPAEQAGISGLLILSLVTTLDAAVGIHLQQRAANGN